MSEELKKQAKELYLKLPRIPTVERVIFTDPKDEPDMELEHGRSVYLHCCYLNGERYIWVSDVEGLSAALDKIIERGIITQKDLALTTVGGLRKLIKLDTLEPVCKELLKSQDFQMWNFRAAMVKAIIRDAWTQFRQVPHTDIPTYEIEQGWKDWEARKALMRGAKQSEKDAERDRQKELEASIEQRLRWRIEYEYKNHKKSLEELVDEIESMGWSVTLHRKTA